MACGKSRSYRLVMIAASSAGQSKQRARDSHYNKLIQKRDPKNYLELAMLSPGDRNQYRLD